jgi:PAT family beta-lactamase induction signal transducer AmpG
MSASISARSVCLPWSAFPTLSSFLWAPIVDAFEVPILGRLLGHRRGWLVFSQLLLMAAILLLGLQDPLQSPWMVALAAVIVATASATQDIVIDAFRVEYLPTENQAAGMAYFVAAYRIGMLVSTAGAVALVAYFEYLGIDRSLVWTYGYAVMAALIVIGLIAALLAKEPREKEREAEAAALGERQGNPLLRFYRAAYAAFADFFSKRDALLILLFVVLYKLTDTFAGVMTGPFVLDIGFDKASYAAIVKGVGLIASLAGGFAGGLLARAMPLSRALLVAGVLQAIANFTFSWLAWLGVNHTALAIRHLDGEFHERHRHGGVRRLSLGAMHQPGAHRHAICAAHGARLVRPHHARLGHGLHRGGDRLGVVLHSMRGCRHSGSRAPLGADQAGRPSSRSEKKERLQPV